MTAMITEARRVTIRGTMAENAMIIAWVADNCPKAAREPSFSSDLTQVILTFEDDTELAKFKLAHSDEFNEAARRDAEFGANEIRGWSRIVPPHANAKLTMTRQIISSAMTGMTFEDDEEGDDD